MKTYIVFLIATSAFAIPTKSLWTEKRYDQEIEPLKAEIQKDVNENIKDELFNLIFNSTYSEKQEFRNEISDMNSDEKLYLTKNLEFILNGNVSLNYDDQYNNDNFTNDGSLYWREMDDTDEYDEEYDHDDDYYQAEFNLGDFDDAKDALKNDAMKNDAMKNDAIDNDAMNPERFLAAMKNDTKDFEKNAPMTSTERFDLPDDRKMHSNEVLEIPVETYNKAIIVLAILSFFMVPPTVLFWIAMCCTRSKRKLNAETEPILNSKPKLIVKKIACMKTKADAQDIKVGECTMIYKN